MPVYFIQAGVGGPIKIGFTTSLWERIRNIRTACPGMRWLTAIDGDKADEAEIHRRFATSRVEGEWFRPSDDLLLFISLQPVITAPLPAKRGRKPHAAKTAIAEWMEAAGVSDDALAADLGVDRTTISRARRAKVLPSSALIAAFVQRSDGVVDPRSFFSPPYPIEPRTCREVGEQSMAAQ